MQKIVNLNNIKGYIKGPIINNKNDDGCINRSMLLLHSKKISVRIYDNSNYNYKYYGHNWAWEEEWLKNKGDKYDRI